MPQASLSRRKFLATTAAASTVIAAPYFVPARAFGANERILTGHIGVGNQGTANLKKFLANAVAVCDVDKDHAAAAAKIVEAKGNKCEIFGDYRKLLDRKDIDAVVITTPDHWHALPTIDACNAGKDVYVEKPLTLFIAEGRRMVDAARANKRIVQTGSQQRSDKRFRLACELVRSGRLGKIQTVLVGIPGPNHA
jgi:predicted dehydrogenase